TLRSIWRFHTKKSVVDDKCKQGLSWIGMFLIYLGIFELVSGYRVLYLIAPIIFMVLLVIHFGIQKKRKRSVLFVVMTLFFSFVLGLNLTYDTIYANQLVKYESELLTISEQDLPKPEGLSVKAYGFFEIDEYMDNDVLDGQRDFYGISYSYDYENEYDSIKESAENYHQKMVEAGWIFVREEDYTYYSGGISRYYAHPTESNYWGSFYMKEGIYLNGNLFLNVYREAGKLGDPWGWKMKIAGEWVGLVSHGDGEGLVTISMF
ncbi:MAG: hypothetical protein Q8P27_02770, partial [Candidatus Peregrinibacteria bacterium]|nr:hypothetical protein [Candidatus Peregrinibacteria bacterium]